jgi:hypothetical protein
VYGQTVHIQQFPALWMTLVENNTWCMQDFTVNNLTHDCTHNNKTALRNNRHLFLCGYSRKYYDKCWQYWTSPSSSKSYVSNTFAATWRTRESHGSGPTWQWLKWLLATMTLKLRFKLYVHESGFYFSNFLSREITGDKIHDACNSK